MSVQAKALDLARGGYSAVKGYENPVVTKELRTRMRAGRAHWTMLVYVLVLSVVLFAVYYSVWIDSMMSGGISNWAQRRVGFNMFTVLTWCQTVLLALIGPSLTAGSLTLENEQQTMEMLSLTTLSPRNIIVGKAGAPALFLWMMLASSLPLAGLCLMFGGISPIEIAIVYILLAVWAFLFCAVGVFWSSIVAKTAVASLLTYGSALGYVLQTSLLAASRLIPGGRDAIALGGLNPALLAYKATATSSVFHINVPLALAAFVVNLGLAILMLTAAQTHLKYHRPDKSLAVRLQLLGLSAFVLLLLFGNAAGFMSYGAGGRIGYELATLVVTSVMLLIYIFTPAFSSGVIRLESRSSSVLRYVLSGFRIGKAFSSDLSGGLPFLMIWTAVCGLVGVVTLSSAHMGMVIPGFVGTMIALMAVGAAYYCFGVFASSFAGTRNLAMVLVFLFIIITFVAYPVMISNYQYGDQRPGTRYELAYLWPALPVVSMEADYRSDALGPTLAVDPHLHWFAVTACYLVLADIFLQLAAFCRVRCRGVTDE